MLVKSKAIDEAYHEVEAVCKALMEAKAAHEEAKAAHEEAKLTRKTLMEAKVAYEVAVKKYQRIYHEEKLRLYPEFEQ